MKKIFIAFIIALFVAVIMKLINRYITDLFSDFFVGWMSCLSFHIVSDFYKHVEEAKKLSPY